MAKRSYVKKSDYWKKFSNKQQTLAVKTEESFKPELIGDPLFTSEASSASPNTRSRYRTNSITTNLVTDAYANINAGLLPYDTVKSGIGVKDAIELCQKAYFNIPVFRSTIDLMSEFANSDIFVTEGSESSKGFINSWLKVINIDALKDQFFREFFRSGNFFPYSLTGKIENAKEVKSLENYAARAANQDIPIKYLVLNPADITTDSSISFNEVGYYKVLTPYELAKLKDPQTDREKMIFDSLDEATQLLIKNGVGTSESVQIKLDPHKLRPVFCKKQDYEPMAIPVGFSVLDDLNKKMELKKVDQMIARSIENVILLITMGTEPDKGGTDAKLLGAMQEIFRNQSVGRVLVSDWTTKADFVIPDLRKVMGKEKYEVLNQDIQEGLQNILMGESKYSDISFKIKVFMKRLHWARNAFLKEFLAPEIKSVCKQMGFRDIPIPNFKKSDTLDDSDLQKLVTRMMELSVLTPEQGLNVINTGQFPVPEDLEEAQEKFLKERKEGHYTPLVNSINIYEEAQGINDKPNSGQSPNKISGPPTGRPVGTSNAEYSRKDLIDIAQEVTNLGAVAEQSFSSKYNGAKKLNKKQKECVATICENIIISSHKSNWNVVLGEILNDLNLLLDIRPSREVQEIGAKHLLDDFSSAILWHSRRDGI